MRACVAVPKAWIAGARRRSRVDTGKPGNARVVLLLAACGFLYSCASSVQAPVESPSAPGATSRATSSSAPSVKQSRQLAEKPPYYVVRRGDTLYSIAWNYGYDYRDVAAWNGIRAPYTIYPGQKIRLDPGPAGQAQKRTTKPADKPASPPLQAGPVTRNKQQQPGAETGTQTPAVKKAATAPKPITTTAGTPRWSWPTRGKLIQADTPISKNGIDISGAMGQQILAAAPGEVVYSGSGLLGYGRLIIIKHDETYLSAYAHNKELLVKEGERVAAGQKIALMGQTSNGRTILHFEIRKNGQPVNPLVYLPKT